MMQSDLYLYTLAFCYANMAFYTFITKDILFITLQKYYYLLYFVGWKRR